MTLTEWNELVAKGEADARVAKALGWRPCNDKCSNPSCSHWWKVVDGKLLDYWEDLPPFSTNPGVAFAHCWKEILKRDPDAFMDQDNLGSATIHYQINGREDIALVPDGNWAGVICIALLTLAERLNGGWRDEPVATW